MIDELDAELVQVQEPTQGYLKELGLHV